MRMTSEVETNIVAVERIKEYSEAVQVCLIWLFKSIYLLKDMKNFKLGSFVGPWKTWTSQYVAWKRQSFLREIWSTLQRGAGLGHQRNFLWNWRWWKGKFLLIDSQFCLFRLLHLELWRLTGRYRWTYRSGKIFIDVGAVPYHRSRRWQNYHRRNWYCWLGTTQTTFSADHHSTGKDKKSIIFKNKHFIYESTICRTLFCFPEHYAWTWIRLTPTVMKTCGPH